MKKINFSKSVILLLLFTLSSCINDLDTVSKTDRTLADVLRDDPNAINGIVSKLYGSFALSGPSGPASSDISDDAGSSPFLRGILNLQDFTADGMKNRWGDDGLDQLTTTSDWDSSNKFFRFLYNRVYFTVPQCNNIISLLKSNDVPNKAQYLAEARFLRSLAYFYMIDCFGKGVLVDENDLGSIIPKPQSSRLQMFNFVESELLAIENDIPLTNSYGRANRSAVRMLLAKLYLNAKVYTGTERYQDALVYTRKVITEGGYSLAPSFVSLFSGDNNVTSAKNEIIYQLIADPVSSQSYGNTTYIVNGSLNDETMTPTDFGTTQNWKGHRATKAWYGLFGNLVTSTDDRAKLFWTTGQNYEMNDYKLWKDGYPSIKFRNKNFIGPSINTDFSGTDFPLYRLADAYLMAAECIIRTNGNTANAEALGFVNQVRSRSNATLATLAELNLDYIIDERGRELNLEGHRRTDLIRFDKFTSGSYLWPWKGNVVGGQAISSNYNLFPIPLAAIGANPNLTQNPGY